MSEKYYYPAGLILKELYLKKNDEASVKAILAELRNQAKDRTIAVPKRTAHASSTLITLFQKPEEQNIIILKDDEYTRLNNEAFEVRKAARLEREARVNNSVRQPHKPHVTKTDTAPIDTGPAHADKTVGRKKNIPRREHGCGNDEGHRRGREESDKNWKNNLF
jgi:hypothetical protein